jgi:hypothetical protein
LIFTGDRVLWSCRESKTPDPFFGLVTMNTDALPASFANHESIIEPRLMDTDNGGLFGLRFG